MKPILYFMKNYYLNKLCKEEVTKEEVANLYDTTIENVEIAEKEFEKRKNPFRKIDNTRKQGIIQILISLISTVVILATLLEMQEERNATYMPNISINCPGIRCIWNDKHLLSNDVSFIDDDYLDVWNEEGDSYVDSTLVDVEVMNTGVGVAKDIYIDWRYTENYAAFGDTFSKCDDIKFKTDDYMAYAELENGSEWFYTFEEGLVHQFGFLSADLNNKESFTIPYSYIELYKIGISYNMGHELPVLRFDVVYNDVQGELYRKEFSISPYLKFCYMSEEGHGMSIYDLRVSEKKAKRITVVNRLAQVILLCLISIIIVSFLIFCCAIAFERKRNKRRTNKNEATSASDADSSITTLQKTKKEEHDSTIEEQEINNEECSLTTK